MKKIVAVWLCVLLILSSAIVVMDLGENAEGKVVVRDGITYITSAPIRIDSNAS